MGGWRALALRDSDIIVYSTISHYEPLVEAVAAPAGLHHQWVGDGSDVDGMVVTGYGTIARRDGTGTGTMAWWNDGTGTMARARWHRHDGPGPGTLAQAQPRAREQLQGMDFIFTDWEDGGHWPCGAVILLFAQQSGPTSHW